MQDAEQRLAMPRAVAPPVEPSGSSDFARIARAIVYLEAHAAEQPGLARVAAHLGLSEFHFQRLFHRWAGVSPKSFLQLLTLNHAKRLLAGSASVLEASIEAGLSGPGRLHDLFVGLDAMTPGEFKAQAATLEIGWGVHPTPYGSALIATTARGVCGFSFLADEASDARALAELHARWPGATLRHDLARTAAVAAEVSARMAGQPAGKPLALLLAGTPFQTQVWRALLAIPEGMVCSYGQLARLAGYPGASRAVGAALGANPIGYLIPCHRVVRASGAAGDYRWGTARKRVLLATEQVRRRLAEDDRKNRVGLMVSGN
jgi:AraC family transcriptional regulator of adaptative response/methylated-DNA-[protein]-cysteine methyltransferase